MNKTLAKILRLPVDQSPAIAFQPPSADVMEKVLLTGDLSALTPEQRLSYYESVCRALKLNPLTKPFEYITLNGRLTLYARKDCTDQLRRAYGISIQILSRDISENIIIVTAQAKMPNGRADESVGAVVLPPSGDGRANAMMKAETKAKRRVTLSICGLGMFDESELETIQDNDAKSRVEEATSNRLNSKTPDEPVTEENFGEVICHIGKAEGNMLGKKVSEIHPNVLTWLQKHYMVESGPTWGSSSNLDDSRLKEAVEIALKKLE